MSLTQEGARRQAHNLRASLRMTVLQPGCPPDGKVSKEGKEEVAKEAKVGKLGSQEPLKAGKNVKHASDSKRSPSTTLLRPHAKNALVI